MQPSFPTSVDMQRPRLPPCYFRRRFLPACHSFRTHLQGFEPDRMAHSGPSRLARGRRRAYRNGEARRQRWLARAGSFLPGCRLPRYVPLYRRLQGRRVDPRGKDSGRHEGDLRLTQRGQRALLRGDTRCAGTGTPTRDSEVRRRFDARCSSSESRGCRRAAAVAAEARAVGAAALKCRCPSPVPRIFFARTTGTKLKSSSTPTL